MTWDEDALPARACEDLLSQDHVELRVFGIDATLVVVEPTLSGIHDLERVLQLLRHFEIIPLVAVNKFDLNMENTVRIEEYAETENIHVTGRIPYDSNVTKAMVNGQPVV